ncbi:Lyase_1 domain-containing protein [Meloidogyne graminicola]|uniref:Lyase_1 domain-containing protein n=1 Tax=Meloidogyne graminicola TaxID=189291 RepID=A0A8T0A295_9BILA|nr:Lyase_1 domain-containing protein [Meloidogyne graminicola]
MNPDLYNSPFCERWCRNSPLLKIFSEKTKICNWRQLWIWLAEAQQELGLSYITNEKIDELKAHQKDINWEFACKKETELKHDVMAHIHAYSEVCPNASGIIHLGVTSCFVQDNADLITQCKAFDYIIGRLAICLDRLAEFILKYAATPTVGRTHLQHASFTTIGKRAALWTDGLLNVFQRARDLRSRIRFRGVKGAVGTQDALLQLFDGDSSKVIKLDDILTKKAGFEKNFEICGQTYPRWQDSEVVFVLASLGSAVHKIAMDIRLLQSSSEICEPFDSNQVGSSAMPYKKNPIRSERICGIARYLMNLTLNPLETYANQGFERTLDDSANRRLILPDAFLSADTILSTLQNILEGLKVNEEVVAENFRQSIPSAILERALMLLTERGEDRQQAHARIRTIALNIGRNPDINLIADKFQEIRSELLQLSSEPIRLCGRAEEQARDYVNNTLKPTIIDVLNQVGKDVSGKRILLDV